MSNTDGHHCGNCANWQSWQDQYDDPDEPDDSGPCSSGGLRPGKPWTSIDDTCERWEQIAEDVKA